MLGLKASLIFSLNSYKTKSPFLPVCVKLWLKSQLFNSSESCSSRCRYGSSNITVAHDWNLFQFCERTVTIYWLSSIDSLFLIQCLMKSYKKYSQTYLHNLYHRKKLENCLKTKEGWHIVSCFHTLNLILLTTFLLCPHFVLVLEANARFHPYLELLWFALIAVIALILFRCVFSLLR